jgi:hypothetical protein
MARGDQPRNLRKKTFLESPRELSASPKDSQKEQEKSTPKRVRPELNMTFL